LIGLTNNNIDIITFPTATFASLLPISFIADPIDCVIFITFRNVFSILKIVLPNVSESLVLNRSK